MNSEFWRGKKVFLTGHTGFKGSWLSLWLQQLGAEVTGYALEAPTSPSLFVEAKVAMGMQSIIGDIRDAGALNSALAATKPDVVIHMAAQPLVRYSYLNPVETYSINLMGTIHLLEAIRQSNTIKAVINVTTDKCYENREWVWGYREHEPMGGYDPYSCSKGCSELVSSSYRRSFFQGTGIALATARAGNVIGGGDWAKDRLIPDVLRSLENGNSVQIRNPRAIRPWQHVLDPLSGYLLLAEKLYSEGADSWADAWNFGPVDDDAKSVRWIVEYMISMWGGKTSWLQDQEEQPHEASYLKLDISKAKSVLGWHPHWRLDAALKNVVIWHKHWSVGGNVKRMCIDQINAYSS